MKTFKLAAVVVAMIAATTNISAQENTGASVEYDFTAVTETGDTAAIDMSYIYLADAFGGQPYDVKFKDGEPKATVITGWSIGAKAGINSYGALNMVLSYRITSAGDTSVSTPKLAKKWK